MPPMGFETTIQVFEQSKTVSALNSAAIGTGAWMYEGVSKSFRTGRLERELQMVQLSATRCSCIVILWVSLVSFAAITLCVASQRVFIVIHFVIASVRKLLDTPSYTVLRKRPCDASNCRPRSPTRIVPEVNSESKQPRGPNQWKAQ
jgi:hypothetical protein